MKILFISPDFPPPFEGGSLVYMYNMVKALAEFPPDDNIDITVLTSRNDTNKLESIGGGRDPQLPLPGKVHIIRKGFLTKSFAPSRIGLAVMYIYLSIFLLMEIILKRYDIIATSSGVVGNSIITFICHIGGLPVMNFVYAEEITIPLNSDGIKNFFKKFLLKKIYPLSDGFISVCRFTGNVLVRKLKIHPDKITVIPPLVATMKIREPSDKFFEKNKQIISVGRLVKRKGFDILINAFSHLLKDIPPDVNLVIVGQGPEEVNLKNLIKSLGIENRVALKGNLDDSSLGAEYSKSRVFVLTNITLPNGDTEGCPTVLLEAMAHGIPVVASREGGTEDAIRDGETGYLADVKNITGDLLPKIKLILSDTALARKFSEAGISRIRKDHSFEKAGRDLYSALKRTLS